MTLKPGWAMSSIKLSMLEARGYSPHNYSGIPATSVSLIHLSYIESVTILIWTCGIIRYQAEPNVYVVTRPCSAEWGAGHAMLMPKMG